MSTIVECVIGFFFTPAGQVITGDVNIINNVDFNHLFLKVQNLGEPKTFTGHFNF